MSYIVNGVDQDVVPAYHARMREKLRMLALNAGRRPRDKFSAADIEAIYEGHAEELAEVERLAHDFQAAAAAAVTVGVGRRDVARLRDKILYQEWPAAAQAAAEAEARRRLGLPPEDTSA